MRCPIFPKYPTMGMPQEDTSDNSEASPSVKNQGSEDNKKKWAMHKVLVSWRDRHM